MNPRASNVDWHSRTWAAEETNQPREVVEAACTRSDLFERRLQMMDDWSADVAGSSGNAG